MSLTKNLPAPGARDPETAHALDGVLVVDFSQFISGPVCSMILADFGADVVKIEKPKGGDDMRRMMAAHPALIGDSPGFLWANRNKRGVALDLTTPEGQALALELTLKADVIVENFSAKVMTRFGLDYDTVRKGNPEVIYCSISACGRDGTLASRLGFDPIAQAEGGFMSINGFPDRSPVVAGAPIIDMTTGMNAANAVLAALNARNRTGEGQLVEVAMFDQTLFMLGFETTTTLLTAKDPVRTGNTSRTVATVGELPVADGALYLACTTNRLYVKMVTEVMERPDILNDPRFESLSACAGYRAEMFEILHEIFGGMTRDAVVAKFAAAGVPAAPIRNVSEAMFSPEAQERGLVTGLAHGVYGTVPNITPPYRMRGTPVATPVAPPLLGQHSAEVLRDILGMDQARIDALTEQGVIAQSNP